MVLDTYEVERFLGEGAFAEVYRVKHRFLGRQAMKLFKRVGMNLDEIRDKLGEAILLTHLKHRRDSPIIQAREVFSEVGTARRSVPPASSGRSDFRAFSAGTPQRGIPTSM